MYFANRLSFLAPILAATFGFVAVAHADTVSFGSVSTVIIIPSADSVTLTLSGTTVTVPGSAAQPGDFFVGYSPIPDQDIQFTFEDTVTVNGVQDTLTFTGDDNVTLATDVLTIDALGPVSIGGDILNFEAVTTDAGGTGQDIDFSLTANVTAPDVSSVSAVPEPSSMALLGTGLLSVAGFARRRFVRS